MRASINIFENKLRNFSKIEEKKKQDQNRQRIKEMRKIRDEINENCHVEEVMKKEELENNEDINDHLEFIDNQRQISLEMKEIRTKDILKKAKQKSREAQRARQRVNFEDEVKKRNNSRSLMEKISKIEIKNSQRQRQISKKLNKIKIANKVRFERAVKNIREKELEFEERIKYWEQKAERDQARFSSIQFMNSQKQMKFKLCQEAQEMNIEQIRNVKRHKKLETMEKFSNLQRELEIKKKEDELIHAQILRKKFEDKFSKRDEIQTSAKNIIKNSNIHN